MKPEFKIKYYILAQFYENEKEEQISSILTQDEVEELWDEYDEEVYDYKYEFREGEVETNVEAPYSRHYESKSVAAQLPNGEWVGWTYWYGGGKHGDPEAIDWIEYAYDLDVTEEEKMVVVRTFKIKE
ncbi:hypothetical protein D3C85_1098150 [compost metagenome]